MTKRALAVIALLMILPIAVALYAFRQFKGENRVVAEYCGSVDIIEYDGEKLRRVEGTEEYLFRLGEYLGKVGDPITGAPLYRVLDDSTGKYFAIADGNRKILYTPSGKLVDGVKGEESMATLLVIDDFLIVENYVDVIQKITGLSGKRVSVDMTKYSNFKYYDLYLAYDGSAIVTEYFGRLISLTDRSQWVFVSPDDLALAEKEYGDEIEETIYLVTLISDEELADIIDSYFDKKSEITKE